MKRYDVKCPICATLNRSLDLEDSEGWMECERCKTASKVLGVLPVVKIPVYTGKQAAKAFAQKA